MKRILLFVFIFLVACSSDTSIDTQNKDTKGLSILELYDSKELNDFFDNFEENFPVSVTVVHDTAYTGYPVVADDKKAIQDVFDALKNLRIVDESSTALHENDYLYYYFTMKDGSLFGKRYFYFQQEKLLFNENQLFDLENFDILKNALSTNEIE